MSASQQTARAGYSRQLLAVYGVVGAPAAWVVELLVGYGTQETACSVGSGSPSLSGNANTAIGLLTVAMLLVATGSAFAARATARGIDAGAIADPRGRIAFMAKVGTVASLLFGLAIVLSGIPVFSVESCHT